MNRKARLIATCFAAAATAIAGAVGVVAVATADDQPVVGGNTDEDGAEGESKPKRRTRWPAGKWTRPLPPAWPASSAAISTTLGRRSSSGLDADDVDGAIEIALAVAAVSVPMVQDVDDVAVWCSDEEPAHTPWLCRYRVHDLIAEFLSFC